jgi:DNA-binding NarL/FixJ family response regulator
MTKILIVDDHPLYREGVIQALSGRPLHATAVGVSSGGDALRALEDDPTFDLVLVDRRLPGDDGVDVLRQIGARHPDVARMLISAENSAETIGAAAQAGAQGFVSKGASIADMLRGIERVLAGEVFWPDPASPSLRAQVPAVPVFTARQHDTLRLLAEGRSNAQIARELGISERTVKAHLKGVFDALGVDTRVRALVKARALGLLK